MSVIDARGREQPVSVVTARARFRTCTQCGALPGEPCTSGTHQKRWNDTVEMVMGLHPWKTGLEGLMSVIDRGVNS